MQRRTTCGGLLLAALALSLPADASTGPARIVRDLPALPFGDVPASIVWHGASYVVFGSDGYALWKSDGTEPGTRLVAKLGDYGNPSELTEFGEHLFFLAEDDRLAPVLWRTDGTFEGTAIIHRFPAQVASLSRLVRFRGFLYFLISEEDETQLWQSDGTREGTRAVARLPTSHYYGDEIAVVPGAIVFLSRSPDSSRPFGLWRFEDAGHGPRLLATFPKPKLGPCTAPGLCPDPIGATGLFEAGRQVFFAATDGSPGLQLWRTDGTSTGTALVRSIDPGPSGGPLEGPAGFARAGRNLFFWIRDREHGIELWKSDGSFSGTVLVKDIRPGPGDSIPNFGSIEFEVVGSTLFFTADDGVRGWQLWKSDGTSDGTVAVAQIRSGHWYLVNPMALDGRLYFASNDGIHGSQLWVSDGSPAGTRIIADPGEGLGFASSPKALAKVGGSVLFAASDSSTFSLWRTDGQAPPQRVRSLAPGGSWEFYSRPIDVSGRAVFPVWERNAASPLFWVSDGTPSGTSRLKDLRIYDNRRAVLAGHLYFVGQDGSGVDWWRTDGTPEGTELVLPGSNPVSFAPVGDRLFFERWDGSVKTLWVTDGNAGGERYVKDMFFVIQQMVGAGRLLFFSTFDTGSEIGLWRSDGTEAGTFPVSSLAPRDPTAAGSLVFFVGCDAGGCELSRSDGMASGTFRLRGSAPGSDGSAPENLTAAGSLLFFTTDEGHELWKSDGTSAGTVLVRDMRRARIVTSFSRPVFSAGRLFFVAQDEAHGAELWATDGTPSGTRLVKDIHPGPAGSGITELTDIGGAVVFGADDGRHGQELWASNGTEEGTVLLQDIAVGPSSSNPARFSVVGRSLYFYATDEVAASELWALPVEALKKLLGARDRSAKTSPAP